MVAVLLSAGIRYSRLRGSNQLSVLNRNSRNKSRMPRDAGVLSGIRLNRRLRRAHRCTCDRCRDSGFRTADSRLPNASGYMGIRAPRYQTVPFLARVTVREFLIVDMHHLTTVFQEYRAFDDARISSEQCHTFCRNPPSFGEVCLTEKNRRIC